MPIKTFTSTVLTASDVNTYLMKQAVITCTSSTRPSAPNEGMTIYETDTDCYVTYNGSAWVHDLGGTWRSYTPTITGVTVGNGTILGRYSVVGKTVTGVVAFAAGSTTSYSASTLSVSLPRATASWYITNYPVGAGGAVHNGTGGSRVMVIPVWLSTTSMNMIMASTAGFVTNAIPFTFGTSANIVLHFSYEAA